MLRMRFALSVVVVTGGSALAQLAVPAGEAQQQKALEDLLHVTQFTTQTLDLPAQPGEEFTLTVNLANEERLLILRPHSMRADDFRLYVDSGDGLEEMAPEPARTYRGHVFGLAGSRVAGSLYDGQLKALIDLGADELWVVQPLSDVAPQAHRAEHAVFAAADSFTEPDWICGNAHQIMLHEEAFDDWDGEGLRSPGNLLTEIAFDADRQFYVQNGWSVANTQADIENVMNNVDFVYDRDTQISYEITTIIVRTSNNNWPYDSSNPSTLLNQFRDHWLANHQDIHRDVAHLMTGRNLGGVLGVAWLNGICNSYGFGLSRSRFSSNMSLRTALTAHELGHNFSANHCDQDGSSCRIMCSALNSCGGVGLPNFGPRSINSITGYASNRPCLDVIPTFFQMLTEVPISQAAIDDDPTLANALTFDLQVEVLADDDWTSTDGTATVDGAIYQHPFGIATPAPGLWGAYPSLEFDSFFSAPNFTQPSFVLGPDITTGSMSALWFDTVNTGSGVFTVARFTLTAGTTLTVSGKSSAKNTWEVLHPFSFTVEVDLPDYCLGDINGDGERDQADLAALLSAYGTSPGDPNWNPNADLDGSGQVGQSDLALFLSVYGIPCP